jgi:protein SCO1/2
MESYSAAAVGTATRVALALAALALLAAGCSKSNPEAAAKSATRADAKGETRYPLTGEVISVDMAKKLARVRHDEVSGFMPAMTMDFAVSDADLAALKPGQRIRAELVPSKTSDFRLEKIWPADKASADAIEAAARQLREDTHNRGKSAYREIGEQAPDFALYDQDGRVVQLSRFRGKQVLLNFIFTRCPDPRMCPASTIKMMTAQKLAREASVRNLELLSITLDAAYDTPAVLKQYATVRGIDTSNFSFVTGPVSAINDLFEQFGIIAEFKGDVLSHTLSTLLIDENGRIVHRADGSTWDPAEFVARMKKS